jgi:Bacterial capsule synthesis protein PGA_cap.
LRCSLNAVEAIKSTGFDLITLANNRFCNYGDEDVPNTLAAYCENGLDTVGGGENLDDAKRIFYKQIKGKRFGFVNFCEHEFSIATGKNGGSNPLNPVANYY